MTRFYHRGRRTVRPRLEMLEDRLAPAVFTPTTFSDGVTPGGVINTLRDAVIAASSDNGTGTDTIQLAAGTYTLTIPNIANNHELQGSQGDLNIGNDTQPIVIQGTTDAGGNPTTIIQQTVADRVFQINNPNSNVTFKNVIIEGGNAQENGGLGFAGQSTAQGGGILDDGGNVTLNNVVVQSNQAAAGTGYFAQGGGIFVQDGTLTVNHSVIQNNTATGGLENGATGEDADGGGICLVATTQGQGTLQLTMTNSSVLNNVAQGGVGAAGAGDSGVGGDAHGGGIYSEGVSNTLTACTVANNKSVGGTGVPGQPNGYGSGGGAELFGSDTIINSTIAGNNATGVNGDGGGVFFAATKAQAAIQLTNDTVVGNQASTEGGGLDNNNGTPQNVTLVNTVVAGNTIPSNAGDPTSDISAQDFVSGGHNLIGIVNNAFVLSATDRTGTASNPLNPQLGPLQNNGGPTQTMLPQPGSPLLSNGDPTAAPGTDQRGLPRPAGGPTDIGAVQVSSVPTSPPPSPSPSPSPSGGGGGGAASPPSLFQVLISLYLDGAELELENLATQLASNLDFAGMDNSENEASAAAAGFDYHAIVSLLQVVESLDPVASPLADIQHNLPYAGPFGLPVAIAGAQAAEQAVHL